MHLIAGGFASIKWYYLPLKWQLEKAGFTTALFHPGPGGFNVWPLDVFLRNAVSVLDQVREDVYLVGHSLGGIQCVYLADLYPDKVRRVFTIGTPVWGTPQKMYEDSIRTLLNASEETWTRFQNEIVPRQASKMVTVSCENDILAPRPVCAVEGASNYVVVADEDGVSASHLLLPYLDATIKIITEETRAELPLSTVPMGTPA